MDFGVCGVLELIPHRYLGTTRLSVRFVIGFFRLQSCVAGSVSMCSSPVFPARLKPLLGEELGPAPPYSSSACRVWGCSATRGNSSPSPSFSVLSANGGWYAVYCLVTRVTWDDALGPSSESAEPGSWEAANLCWWYYRGFPAGPYRGTRLCSPPSWNLNLK